MLKLKKSFIDFKLQIYFGHFFFKRGKGVANEYRKNCFRSNNGISPITRISQVCGKIQRKLQGKKLFSSGPISLHGICSTDLSGKPSRYRGMSTCCQNKTLWEFGEKFLSVPWQTQTRPEIGESMQTSRKYSFTQSEGFISTTSSA